MATTATGLGEARSYPETGAARARVCAEFLAEIRGDHEVYGAFLASGRPHAINDNCLCRLPPDRASKNNQDEPSFRSDERTCRLNRARDASVVGGASPGEQAWAKSWQGSVAPDAHHVGVRGQRGRTRTSRTIGGILWRAPSRWC